MPLEIIISPPKSHILSNKSPSTKHEKSSLEFLIRQDQETP